MSNSLKETKKHKIVSVAFGLTTALLLSSAVYFAPLIAGAQTVSDLQAQIAALLAQINQLQSQLTTLQGGAPAAASCSFTKDLTMGSKGDDVKCLQTYLTGTGHFSFSGGSTSYFGSVTKSAVAAWQAANGVTPAVGYFGSISRAKYSAVAGVATPTTPTTLTTPGTVVTPVGSGLTITAGIQPSGSLFPDNSTRVPFTVMNLIASSDGDVTVDSITVERTGLAADAAFGGVVLLDDKGTQIGIVKTLNSEHKAILSEDFVVKAGQTKTVVIAGNSKTSGSGYGGQVAYLSVATVAANAKVNGTFPIVGAGHTINETLTIGSISSVARGALDPGSSQTKEVGTKDYTFSSVKFTSGSAEDVYVKYMRWYQSGSASKDDLANIKVHVNGSSYDPVVSADGKYYTASFLAENSGKGVLLAKGFSKEFTIKGDIAGGSARTVDFDIQKRTDVAFNGGLYGYGITPPFGSDVSADAANFDATDDPWYDAAEVLISAGTITVSTNSVLAPAQNIAVNLAAQPLAAFTVDVRGEAISITRLAFNVSFTNKNSGDDVSDITSVSVYDENGAVIAGPSDGVTTEVNTGGATGTSHGEIIFTDTITFPMGVHSYVLKGKVGTDIDNNDTIQASTTPRNFGGATGVNTGKTITIDPNSILTFGLMTVKTGDLTVSVSASPIAQTVIQGAKQFVFANYTLDTTASGEDIRLVSLPVEYNFNGGAAATDLTSCKIYDGVTVINSANVKNPSSKSSSTSFVFDGSGITLAKGTTKTITLKCDVSGSAAANGFYEWGIDAAEDTNFTGASGLTSGQETTETFNGAVGQRMTAQTGGSLAVSLNSGSPGYKIVSAGATGVELTRLNFTASNEDVQLRKLVVERNGTASNSPTDLVGQKVTFWTIGGVQVGEATFPLSTSQFATSSTITGFTVPRDDTAVMIIKGDISAMSVSGPLTVSGDFLKIDYDGGAVGLAGGTYGVGVASGNNVTPTGSDTTSTGIRIMRGYPTFAKLAVPNNTILGGNQSLKTLYRFSVKANDRDVSIFRFSFLIGSSTISATTSTYGLYAYTDSFNTLDTTFTSDGLVNYGNCVNGNNGITLTTGAPGLKDSPTTVTVHPDKGTTACNATTTYIVPTGQTRYFDLTATVINGEARSSISETISATLLGDAAYPDIITVGAASGNMFASLGVDSDTSDHDFIWSPNSTTTNDTTAELGNVDYTNGYGVTGLPATNMVIEYFTSTY
jgi:hypothetical protein